MFFQSLKIKKYFYSCWNHIIYEWNGWNTQNKNPQQNWNTEIFRFIYKKKEEDYSYQGGDNNYT